MRYYTPLRYPGGKSSLAHYMRRLLIDNQLVEGVYVEPYAGGAAVAMELVMTGYAREVWLNDIDPAIHAFWNAALNQTEELVDLLENSVLTVDEWRHQRTICLQADNYPSLELGFAALYLNRVNRSGILNGGLIGGLDQKGKWGIDARFNREGLAERILRVAEYRHRIRLFGEDAEAFLRRIAGELPERSLVYLDPPYYHKGQRLYRNHYNHDDHSRIAGLVQSGLFRPWVVSYDNTPEIAGLYSGRRQLAYTLNYSAQTKRLGDELIVFSDGLEIPDIQNPARYRLN